MTERVIHLDMDGVLADFNSTASAIIGEDVKTTMKPKSELWNILKHHQDLFLTLDPLPDAHELFNGVKSFASENDFRVEILTAVPLLSSFPLASVHKYDWFQRHFESGIRFKIGPHSKDKWKHARVGDVLIDDKDLNITQWNNAGGIGILHLSAVDSLSQLHDIT